MNDFEASKRSLGEMENDNSDFVERWNKISAC